MSDANRPTETVASGIVNDILHDIKGRRGFRQEWDGLDTGVQLEIIQAWLGIAREHLRAAPEPAAEPPREFVKELESLINQYGKERGSNTPDFILAEYLNTCLHAYNFAVKSRDAWYGINPAPGDSPETKGGG